MVIRYQKVLEDISIANEETRYGTVSEPVRIVVHFVMLPSIAAASWANSCQADGVALPSIMIIHPSSESVPSTHIPFKPI